MTLQERNDFTELEINSIIKKLQELDPVKDSQILYVYVQRLHRICTRFCITKEKINECRNDYTDRSGI